MRRSSASVGLALLFIAGFAKPAVASDELKDVDVHAFLSQGFIKATDDINYLGKSGLGSFDLTEVGINFTKQLNDNLRAGFQFFARRFGSTGDFDAKFDWFYLDYHPSDFLGLRFGRVKIPFGLYNEVSDAESARVPILLPQSIYPSQHRDYLLAQNGLELYGYTGSSSLGALEYRLYGGTIFLDLTNAPGAALITTDLNTPFVVGSRVMWETPLDGFRTGGTFQALRIDTNQKVGATSFNYQFPVLMWIGSAEYTHQDLQASFEYSMWNGKIANSSIPNIFPNISVTSERTYLMGNYRVSDWLQPGLYYSFMLPNIDKKEGRENFQHDVAATLRFDLNRYWLLKLEGHYMIGTAGLTDGPVNKLPLSQLPEHWGAFLIETTGYF